MKTVAEKVGGHTTSTMAVLCKRAVTKPLHSYAYPLPRPHLPETRGLKKQKFWHTQIHASSFETSSLPRMSSVGYSQLEPFSFVANAVSRKHSKYRNTSRNTWYPSFRSWHVATRKLSPNLLKCLLLNFDHCRYRSRHYTAAFAESIGVDKKDCANHFIYNVSCGRPVDSEHQVALPLF